MASACGSVHWKGLVAGGLEWLLRPYGMNWMSDEEDDGDADHPEQDLLPGASRRTAVPAMLFLSSACDADEFTPQGADARPRR